MKKNIGTTDKWIRIVLGVIVIALGFYYESWWGALGLIPLVTAMAGTYPTYMPFGISTRREHRPPQGKATQTPI